MEPVARAAAVRLFFGLPVGAVLDIERDPLRTIIDEAQGRAVPAANLHATLAFLGSVPEAALGALSRIGEALPRAGFVLELDQVGSFRGARVTWAGPSRVPSALIVLHAALMRSLRDAGYALDDRPFHPHVTIARHCRRVVATRAIAPIAWRVDRLVLYESVTTPHGPRYDARATWPLEAP